MDRTQRHGLTRSGRGWYRRVGGVPKYVCSSKIEPEEADRIFEARFADLARAPVAVATMTVEQLADQFAAHQRTRREANLINWRTLSDYEAICRRLVECCGSVMASHMGAAEFLRLTQKLAAYSPAFRARAVTIIRQVFKWAVKPGGFLHREPDYGDDFCMPKRSDFRRAKHAAGRRMYSAKEIKALLARAAPQLKAMILLALNGGMGNGDLSEMPRTAVDLKAALVNYPRPKTQIERRIPLWPETVAAIEKLPQFESGRVFELPNGHPWIRVYDGGSDDHIGLAFSTLCDDVKVTNRGFYSLRRTFRTLADDSADQRAIALVMGHECGDIGGVYVQKISNERLRAVVDCVRSQIASALV